VGLTNQLAAVSITLSLLNSGLFRPEDSGLPPPLVYYNYISIPSYSAKVLSINEFLGREYTCDSPSGGNSTCPYTTGREVLKSLSIDPDNLWFYFGMVMGLAVVYRLSAYLLLHFRPVKQSV